MIRRICQLNNELDDSINKYKNTPLHYALSYKYLVLAIDNKIRIYVNLI